MSKNTYVSLFLDTNFLEVYEFDTYDEAMAFMSGVSYCNGYGSGMNCYLMPDEIEQMYEHMPIDEYKKAMDEWKAR